MENFFTRMNAKGIVTSLVLALSISACSSKQGVDAGDEVSSEVQAEEDMMLGEGSSGEFLSDDGTETFVSGDEDLGTPTAEIINSSGMGMRTNVSVWRGSLKSTYTPGMSHWTVSRGESLSLIAQAVYGSSTDYKKLLALNPEIRNANDISVGQRIRLPGSSPDEADLAEQAEAPVTNTPVAAAPQAPSAPAASSAPSMDELNTATTTDDVDMPVVSNTDPSLAPAETAAPQEAPADSQAGAMGTVETAAPSAPTDAPAAQAEMGGLVKRVDMGGNKLKLRNILLGVAAFFLLLSGVIFVLSRKKAKAG